MEDYSALKKFMTSLLGGGRLMFYGRNIQIIFYRVYKEHMHGKYGKRCEKPESQVNWRIHLGY